MAKEVRRKERTKFVSFYVSDEEKRAIVSAADRNDMSISDYCRKVLMRNNQMEGGALDHV